MRETRKISDLELRLAFGRIGSLGKHKRVMLLGPACRYLFDIGLEIYGQFVPERKNGEVNASRLSEIPGVPLSSRRYESVLIRKFEDNFHEDYLPALEGKSPDEVNVIMDEILSGFNVVRRYFSIHKVIEDTVYEIRSVDDMVYKINNLLRASEALRNYNG